MQPVPVCQSLLLLFILTTLLFSSTSVKSQRNLFQAQPIRHSSLYLHFSWWPMKMAVVRLFTVFSILAMLVDLAMAATNYTVGAPNGGWDLTTDLQSWSSSQSFLVGDNLIFVYTVNHEVLEVSKQNYELCDGSTPLQSFTGGNTVIALPDPSSRYFICGVADHCSSGMKLEIVTLSPPSSSPSSSPSPPPTVASTPPNYPRPPTPRVTVPSSPPFASPPAPPPDNLVHPPEFSPPSSPPSPDFPFNPVLVPVSPSVSPPPPPSFGFRLNLSFGFSFMSVILIVLIL